MFVPKSTSTDEANQRSLMSPTCKIAFIENQFSWFGFDWKRFHSIYNQLKLIKSPQINKKSSNLSLADQIGMQKINH